MEPSGKPQAVGEAAHSMRLWPTLVLMPPEQDGIRCHCKKWVTEICCKHSPKVDTCDDCLGKSRQY